MTLREAAFLSRSFDGDFTVIKFLDIVERILQSAVGKLRLAVVDGGSSAALVHVVEQKEETGLDQHLAGSIAFFLVCQHELNAGGHGLVKTGASWIKTFHRFLAAQKGKDIFVIAEIIFRTLEERGVKHDIEIFSAFQIALLYRMYCMGKDYDQIVCAECGCLSPQSDLYLSFGTVNQFKIIVPVQGKRRNPLGDAPHVNTIGKSDDAVKLGLVYWRGFHMIPPRISDVLLRILCAKTEL